MTTVDDRLAAVEDDLENLSGLERGRHLDTLAHEQAILAIVDALSDIAPLTRTMIADDLEERLQRVFAEHPDIVDGTFDPPDGLVDKIRSAK